MSLHRRLLAAFAFVALVGMILACGGTGTRNSNAVKTDPEKIELSPSQKEPEEKAFFDSETEPRQTDYQQRLAKYKEDKEAFDKAVIAYKAAKTEYIAAKKLDEAQQMYKASLKDGASKLLKEYANQRWRDIIERYPDTESAKDAKILLDGGEVVAREVGAEPVPPIPPTEPGSSSSPQFPTVALSDIPNGDYKTTGTGDYQTPVRLTNGKTVYVRGYTRANGTYVRPYTRSQPTGQPAARSGGRGR
jgi:hypothetical protein